MSGALEFDRKYRPQDFESYVGNNVVKEKLKSMLKNGNIPHSMIFSGPSGTGKTTMARIMSKALSCKNPTSDGLPCEECENCLKINEKFILQGGRIPGLPIQEVDVNLDGSKDSVTQLIDEMKTKPLGKQKKIYILDEVQVMSPKAQSSLLKVLEEPNEWLYIILCTTHPDNLLDAIRTRLTGFSIRQPSRIELRNRLIYICQQEKIKYEKTALDTIIKVSGKSPRACLKNLEKVASSGDVTYEVVQREFNVTKMDMFIEYFKCLDKDIFAATDFLEKLQDNYEMEPMDFLDKLSEFSIDAFNIKMGASLENYTEDEAKEMGRLFKQMSLQDMIRLINYIEDALKLKSNARFALFMLTLRYGFPEYFTEINNTTVQEDLRKEEEKSVKTYVKNKKEIAKSKERNEEITESDILSMFEDAFLVEEAPTLDEEVPTLDE